MIAFSGSVVPSARLDERSLDGLGGGAALIERCAHPILGLRVRPEGEVTNAVPTITDHRDIAFLIALTWAKPERVAAVNPKSVLAADLGEISQEGTDRAGMVDLEPGVEVRGLRLDESDLVGQTRRLVKVRGEGSFHAVQRREAFDDDLGAGAGHLGKRLNGERLVHIVECV
jgi:hypothetical protein